MSKRKYEPGAFVPCSRKHKSCSPAHAQLVAGYREERERQEKLFEAETGNYEGDIKWHKENGHQLITFKTWLKANGKGSGATGQFQNESQETTIANNYLQQESGKLPEFSPDQVDQIFNQMTEDFMTEVPVKNAVPTDTAIFNMNVEGTQNEEECNCDCNMCCRNDHIACCNDNDPCCLSGPM